MENLTLVIFAGLNTWAAILLLRREPLAAGFPWVWALWLAAALAVGGVGPLGLLDHFICFVTLLAAVIVAPHLRQLGPVGRWAAVALAVWVLADSFRLINTPDQLASLGELMLWGWARRPYAFYHPNLLGAWALLLPLGLWTIIVIIFSQSRAALAGLILVAILRFVPKRYLGLAALAGLGLLVGALMIRPGSALGRFEFWNEGIRFFLARPLTGWGSSSYGVSLTSPAGAAMNQVVNFKRTEMQTAHNALITIAAENGILGLISFIGFGAGLARIVYNSQHPARWGLAAFWFQQCFDDQWLHPIGVILMGFVIWLCLSQVKNNNPAGLIESVSIPAG